MASDTLPAGREKVTLRKGFHMTDWIQLTSSAKDLSGAKRNGGLRGYTMEEVKQHRSEHDAWAVFFGKVYNITPYLHYHPGGMDILVKTAGRDCTSLFQKYHPWVNIDGLAGKLVVGHVVDGEGRPIESHVDDNQKGSVSGGIPKRSSTTTTTSGGKTFPAMEPPKPKVPILVQDLLAKDSDHSSSSLDGSAESKEGVGGGDSSVQGEEKKGVDDKR